MGNLTKFKRAPTRGTVSLQFLRMAILVTAICAFLLAMLLLVAPVRNGLVPYFPLPAGSPTPSPATGETPRSPFSSPSPSPFHSPQPPSPVPTRPYVPLPATAGPRPSLRSDEGTPPPTETPTPVPITVEEALEGYRRWVASLGDAAAQEYWFLRSLAPGAQVYSTAPRVVRIDAAVAQAVVEDTLHYQGFGWTPSGQGKYNAEVLGLFVMEKRPSGEWVLVDLISPTPVPPLPPPTRDPNAPTPRGWSYEDAAAAAQTIYEHINHWRQVNNLPPLTYAWEWQEAANRIAAVIHEKGIGAFTWDADAAPILAEYGIPRGYLDGHVGVPIVVTIGSCYYGDCKDIYVGCYQTNPLTSQARYTRVVIGFYGPFAGPLGPSIDIIIIGGW